MEIYEMNIKHYNFEDTNWYQQIKEHTYATEINDNKVDFIFDCRELDNERAMNNSRMVLDELGLNTAKFFSDIWKMFVIRISVKQAEALAAK